jgi:hypothetical protein
MDPREGESDEHASAARILDGIPIPSAEEA